MIGWEFYLCLLDPSVSTELFEKQKKAQPSSPQVQMREWER